MTKRLGPHRVIVTATVLAAFFAAAETALTRMMQVKAHTQRRRAGVAPRLARLVENPETVPQPGLLLMLLFHFMIASLVALLVEATGAATACSSRHRRDRVIFVFARGRHQDVGGQHPERSALLSPRWCRPSSVPAHPRHHAGADRPLERDPPGKGLKEGPFVSEADMATSTPRWTRSHRARGAPAHHSILEFGDTVCER